MDGRGAGACAALCSLLETAPPRHVAWLLPVEPFFVEPFRAQTFAAVCMKLADRAR
jgi:hypothetical protein